MKEGKKSTFSLTIISSEKNKIKLLVYNVKSYLFLPYFGVAKNVLTVDEFNHLLTMQMQG